MKKVAIYLGLMLICAAFVPKAFAQGQKSRVSGIVVDVRNNPVTGADVIEVGAQNATITDDAGRFNLILKREDSQIKISFLGYKSVTLPSSADFSRIVLQEDTQVLGDIVIIGYGTVKKSDMTGSVQAVKTDERNREAISSPQQMLQGKIAGVQVIPGDGGPGSSSTIRVRGAASLNASNDPLFVIDGVPIGANGGLGMANPLSTINPNDIESFTVLKDASATAIYGSRASNGVIIITTKKGQSGKIKVSYNGSFNVVTNSATIDVLNGNEYRAFAQTYAPSGTDYGDVVQGYLGKSDTDWQKAIYRTGISHDHNISVYGSLVKMLPFRASLGATLQQGTLKTSSENRYTADLSLTPKFFDGHLSVTANAKGIYADSDWGDGGAVNAAIRFDPTQDKYFRNSDGSIRYSQANGYWNWLNSGSDGSISPNNLAIVNPLSLLYDRDNTGDAYRFIGNLQLNYKVHGLEDLNLNVNVGTDMSKTNGTDGVNVGSIQAYRDSEATGCGQYRDWNDFHRNQILETYADYSHKFLGKHTVNIMAGYSWQHFYTSRHEIRYTNPYSIDSATGDYINGSDHASVLIGEMSNYPYNRTEYYLLSYYGRLNYSYESKYLFTATLRNDASSRFSKDNRWGLFPSAAIAWNVKNENFLKRNDFISTLKLRASWGETGQQEINDGDYPYMSRYVESTDQYSQYNMGSDGFFQKYTPQAYDPNIKWETTTTYNAGFDLGVMKDKVTMNADFYYRKTKDLLNNVTVPLGSNFSNTVLTNVGSMENKGIELSLNYTPINTQYSSMQIGVNCTFQKIKFTKLNKSDDPDYAVSTGDIHAGTGGFLQYQKVGYAPYTYFLYQQAYDEDGRPIQNALVDRNSDGKLSAADRYMTNKSPNPDFFFGINFKYNYRNWDFAFSGHGSVGNWLFNDFESENSQAYIVIASAFLPNITKYALNNNFTSANITEQFYSDMFLHNASFFRMDNIEGGYTFKNVDKKGVDIRIALGVSNVFIITRYPGMDPEATDVNGIDSNIWPRPRTFSLKLNVNF